MNYKALGDTIVVRISEAPKMQTRESGIIFMDSESQAKTTIRAEVISVGEGRFDEKNGVYVPVGINVGDIVVTSLSVGIELDKTHRMLRADDVFAIVE